MDPKTYINNGFDKLLPALTSFIGVELRKKLGVEWWREGVLEKLNDPHNQYSTRDLPRCGTDTELLAALDVQACFKIIAFNWNDVFSLDPVSMSKDQRNYLKELQGVRIKIAHPKQNNALTGDDAYRALDTMIRFIKPINPDTAQDIQSLMTKEPEQKSAAQPAVRKAPTRKEHIVHGDAFSQIKHAAAKVKGLSNTLIKGAASVKDASWWANTGLSPLLDGIIERLDKVYQDLSHPCLKIAFVGTTSSGKSTLLNGLAGHRIAPMESAEMSAGVVRIRNGADISMTVRETPGMTWNAGTYRVNSDEDIYNAMRADDGIMKKYKQIYRNDNEVKAPEIEITIPLAPKNGGIPKFAMPEELGLEFYDLPGLKSMNDPKNLTVVQNYLADCFLVVVINYSDTNEDARLTLLQQIKKVAGICNNTDAMLFVLNRVDERNITDDPLENRLADLRSLLMETLALPREPVVIPMSALPLYHLQAAWGVQQTPLYAQERIDESEKHLVNFFQDCPKIIKQMQLSPDGSVDRAKKQWFKDHDEDNIREEGAWESGDIPQLLGWVYEYSGAYKLWETLQKKLDEQIGAVIINPAMGESVSMLREFSTLLQNSVLPNLRLSSEEEVKQKKAEIETLANEIKKNLAEFTKQFGKNFTESIEAFKSRDAARIQHSRYAERFSIMRDVLRQIRNDVHDTIMVPIRDAFIDSDTDKISSLEIKLGEVIPPQLSKDICRAITNMVMKGYDEQYAQNGRTVKCEVAEKAKYQNDIDKVEMLNTRWQIVADHVDKALLNRSLLLLQEKIKFFTEQTEEILAESVKELKEQLSGRLGEQNIQNLFAPITFKKGRRVVLPDNVFNLSVEGAKIIMEEKKIQEYY
jgi:ribosome biogenesis GTPase A